jgi:hypothetical protein
MTGDEKIREEVMRHDESLNGTGTGTGMGMGMGMVRGTGPGTGTDRGAPEGRREEMQRGCMERTGQGRAGGEWRRRGEGEG